MVMLLILHCVSRTCIDLPVFKLRRLDYIIVDLERRLQRYPFKNDCDELHVTAHLRRLNNSIKLVIKRFGNKFQQL